MNTEVLTLYAIVVEMLWLTMVKWITEVKGGNTILSLNIAKSTLYIESMPSLAYC